MSLINDALKKAQKQRTGETPAHHPVMPVTGSERPAQFSRPSNPPAILTLLMPISLSLIALMMLIGGGVWLFRDRGSVSPPVATTPAATTQVAMAAPVASAPIQVAEPPKLVAATPPPSAPASSVSTFVVPNVTPPAPVITRTETPKPAAPKPEPVQPAVVPVAVAAVETAAVEQTPAVLLPAKIEPKAINFIEAIRVAGIRASTTDSKVLMNDRVYRLNDIVEHEMGLKLVGITANSLTFEDEHGSRYTRSF